MPYDDLRQWLDKLEQEGEVTRVKIPVDINYELGAICRKVLDHRGPVLLFENLPGYEIPIAVNMLASRRRYALALETTPEEIHAEWARRTVEPVEPVIVDKGPCQENVYIGDEVDLSKFPIPLWNELDGGPYITIPTHISKDPDTGVRNAGMYRTQVHDKNLVGLMAAPYRHLINHMNKAHSRGEALPVAIVNGVEPTITIATVSPFPFGMDELTMASALRGKPVELVRCKTIPLEVPATAEVVLEGEIRPGDMREEGPFGEFTGYYGARLKRPVIRIKALTHRDNPVWAATYEGRPFQETNPLMGIACEAEILRQVKLPGIKKLLVTDGGCGYFNAIISVKKEFEGYGKMVGMAALGTWASRSIKNLIIVDEDIDPSDWTQVEWALATRLQPHRDVEILTEMTGVMLDPSLPLQEKVTGSSRTSKMIIDATKYDAKDFEIACMPKPDVMERVEREWEKYGIKL